MGNFARLVAASKADYDQSPRLPDGEGKRGHSSSSLASRLAQGVHKSAGLGTIPALSGRKWVASLARFESQTIATTVALAVALALLLISSAHAHVEGCHTRKCDRRISAKRHRHFWINRFNAFSPSWRQWAHSTSWCEASHRADTNTGNGFYGAFQYTLQTAWVAGFHRRPDLTTWHEQAVRSIRYAQRHGTGAWPVCG